MTHEETEHSDRDSRFDRNETPAERADRNWTDLLQELRVSQTGVQLLAGFLVTLPFQDRFDTLTDFQKDWYLAILGLAFLTVGVTLTPVAIHRRLFGGGAKHEIVRAAHVMTGVALGLIAVLLAGIAVLVVDVVLGGTATVVAGTSSLLVLMGLLVIVPRRVHATVQRS